MRVIGAENCARGRAQGTAPALKSDLEKQIGRLAAALYPSPSATAGNRQWLEGCIADDS